MAITSVVVEYAVYARWLVACSMPGVWSVGAAAEVERSEASGGRGDVDLR